MSKRKISNRKLIIQLGRDESIFALWDKSAQIIHSVALPTPIGAVEDGMIQNPDAVRELLQSAMALPEFEGVYNTIFTLCTSQVITETVVTPNLSGKKLEKLLLSNMDMYFPVDISEYRLVWQTVGQHKGIGDLKELSVQLWAIPTAMLSRYYIVGNAAGLSVNAIDYCGNSVASAVGASFSANSKKAKEHKKFDLNKEITFGRKKKAEEAVQNEEAESKDLSVEDTAVNTDLHLTLEKDLIGLTFIQNSRVVHQRFIQSGSNPAYIFDDIAMMVEYFRSLEYGRNSEITGYVSGAMGNDTELIADLSDILDMPLTAPSCDCDPVILLCAGAALTKMDFGIPAMNRPNEELTQMTLQVGQTAALATGAAALAGVVALTFIARFSWNATIDSLEARRENLLTQAQKVAGYADKYKEYTTLYDNYSSDWNTVFNNLRTYNDNLVRVMEELETIMPDKASVTELTIGTDGMNVKFACETKEQAAYLIMQLRELQYAQLNGISNLSGGGRGAAKTYGNGEKAPTEGNSQLTLEQRNALANTLISDFNIYNVTTNASNMSLSDIKAFESEYGKAPSTNIIIFEGTELEVAYNCTTLHELENYYTKFINIDQSIDSSMRKAAISTLLDTNPFAATRFAERMKILAEKVQNNEEVDHRVMFINDLDYLYNVIGIDYSTPEATKKSMTDLIEICTLEDQLGSNITETEKLFKQDPVLEQWYVYYLQEEINKSFDIKPDAPVEDEQKVQCEYLALDTLIDDLMVEGEFSSSNSSLNHNMLNLLSDNTKNMLAGYGVVVPTPVPSTTPPSASPTVPPSTVPTTPPSTSPSTEPTTPPSTTVTPTPGTNFLEEMGLSQEAVSEQLGQYIQDGSTDYAPILDDQIGKYITTGKSDYPDLDSAMNQCIEQNLLDTQIRSVAAEYLNTGTTKNPTIGAAIEQYLSTGKSENTVIDNWAKSHLSTPEAKALLQDCLQSYVRSGTTGYKHFDTMVKKYLDTGKSGYVFVDNMIDRYADEFIGGYIATGDTGIALINTALKGYFTVGTSSMADLDRIIEFYLEKQVDKMGIAQFETNYKQFKVHSECDNDFFDLLFMRHKLLKSSGSKTLDNWILNYEAKNGNANSIANSLGNTGKPTDTRIAFTVSLSYNDDLMRAELERKGLSNDSKVDKLEVNR